MLNNLLGVLLRFREEKIGIVGDISKMYHTINITLFDQMTPSFLRNLDTSKEPDTYVMQVVNFGGKPSATIALIALRKTAEMFKQEFPEASNKFVSYIDDIVDCKVSNKEAYQICRGRYHIGTR